MTHIRAIEHRYAGKQHGMIRRLISPEALGDRLKPFIFLDFLNTESDAEFGFGFHPHSGIATLTYQLGADVQYEDTAGQKGVVLAGGLEWMQAGGGVWHQGFIQPKGSVTGFQLWIALPPDIEDGVSKGQYIPPEAVPLMGNVKVLLGSYGDATSPISTPSSIHYFDLALKAGEYWSYQPPISHTIAWLFVYQGEISVSSERISQELLLFDQSDGRVAINAITEARALIGTAVKHDYPLVLASSSVHTNSASLEQGKVRIQQIGAQLRTQGKI